VGIRPPGPRRLPLPLSHVHSFPYLALPCGGFPQIAAPERDLERGAGTVRAGGAKKNSVQISGVRHI
jgi:hypothetical protein